MDADEQEWRCRHCGKFLEDHDYVSGGDVAERFFCTGTHLQQPYRPFSALFVEPTTPATTPVMAQPGICDLCGQQGPRRYDAGGRALCPECETVSFLLTSPPQEG